MIRSVDGNHDLPLGKVVRYHGEWIVHSFVYGKYRRISQAAWGVRAPLARFMAEEDVTGLYFLDNGRGVTWRISLDRIRRFGVLGKPDQFGGTLNLPEEQWSKVADGKLSLVWVPDEDRLVLEACSEPWPMPKPAKPQRVEKKKPARKQPAGETLAMPFF